MSDMITELEPGPGATEPTPVEAGTSQAAAELLAHRPMLFGLAYRLLGSLHDAEDVLQETYLRWLSANRVVVAEPRRYLSRVVTRLALDRLRARQAARETYIGQWLPEPVLTAEAPFGPLDSAEQRESVSLALLHLLERLTPPERAVYVLRTAFDLPYAEIARIIDRSPEDCRQLHHRAGTQLGRDRPRFPASKVAQQRLLDGFLAAAQNGDLPALTRLMSSDVTAWSDGGGRVRAARNPIFGVDRVARFFTGICTRRPGLIHVQPVELNAGPAVMIPQAGLAGALLIDVFGDQIRNIYLVGNPDKLTGLPG